jgi:hypothetical protein
MIRNHQYVYLLATGAVAGKQQTRVDVGDDPLRALRTKRDGSDSWRLYLAIMVPREMTGNDVMSASALVSQWKNGTRGVTKRIERGIQLAKQHRLLWFVSRDYVESTGASNAPIDTPPEIKALRVAYAHQRRTYTEPQLTERIDQQVRDYIGRHMFVVRPSSSSLSSGSGKHNSTAIPMIHRTSYGDRKRQEKSSEHGSGGGTGSGAYASVAKVDTAAATVAINNMLGALRQGRGSDESASQWPLKPSLPVTLTATAVSSTGANNRKRSIGGFGTSRRKKVSKEQ